MFDQVRGVLVGYIYGLQALKKKPTQMEEVLFKITKEHDFPIVKTNDFGHQSPNTILPVGSRVRLDAQKRQMELLEEYVV